MARNYSNIALDTTLTAGIAAGDLSCVVASASGWPAAPFAAVLDPGLVTEEVVQVTVKVGTTFTITRGFDGTTAAIHALGAVVRHSAIAGDFTDLQAADSAHAALTTGAHGGISASGHTHTTGLPAQIGVAVSDETTALTTGAGKLTFRMPYAMTVTSVRASLKTASSSGIPTIDVNEGGMSIFSTTLTIDANEKTSTTAAVPAVISDSALADDAEITVDIDTAGTGAVGLKLWLIGVRA